MALALANVTLDDKYALERGRVYITGIQALVRLPILQKQRDQHAGLNTGGFISGYRGSPLGMYDHNLHQARKFLQAHNIYFQPGINEDQGMTAVWGSQQVGMFQGAKVDGVFGIWYGKGPGVDRSMDPLKHGNHAGSSKHGGVLVLAGDDHGAQSSTLPHQSEQVFEAAMMPVFNPATVQEYLDLGILGFALSRYSGCWVGFKAISEAVESAASVSVDPHRLEIVTPIDFAMPDGGLNIRWPDPPLAQELRLHQFKLPAVAAFARANKLDRVVMDSSRARLGIVATGKAYLDLRQAFEDLGIDEAKADQLGLRVYKVVMSWPLEPEGLAAFAQGLEEIVVVEEKRPFLENQIARILYNLPADKRPRLIGKRDDKGAPLMPTEGELTPGMVARAMAQRLARLYGESPEIAQRLARVEAKERQVLAPATNVLRTPFFCSGCPHNTSTRVPDGSRAMAGIGCHGMAVWMPNRNTQTMTHMGGEGVNWIGQAPFTSEPHVFQNLGDGTYYHSGFLAIRAAAAAKVNITYKILFNDAVAMTGGQPHDGPLTVPAIANQVWAEGAKQIVVVTDEPDKYPAGTNFPPGVAVRHRDELDTIQKELREVQGLSVMIYDQTCAAEKRRRRKRGLYPDPPKRAFINDAVCEGCGDCSEKSNCVSVRPLETEFGRKRQIDQSNCNKDFSCVKGFCPSFVTVHGGSVKKSRARPKVSLAASGHKRVGEEAFADLPAPNPVPLTEPFSMIVTGIGGTGVLTVGALIGMAAHLEGRGCTVLDFTGLAQKNGAVMSHIRLAPKPEDLHAVRVGAGGARLVLGCDMVVAASPNGLSRVESGVTRAVINSFVAPTAGFVLNGDIDFGAETMKKSIREAVGEGRAEFLDATQLATAILGDSIATNIFMLGYAMQKGLVPLSVEAIEKAIELNGVAVETNKRTLNWGRLAAHDMEMVQAEAKPRLREEAPRALTLDELIDRRARFLTEYQDATYAQTYRDFVATVEAAEKAQAKGKSGLAEAVARNLFKLMAYKDEYEVARLYTDGAFLKKLNAEFEGDFKLEFHLAPPLMAARDPATGELQKRAYGPWVFTAFKILAKLKGLRGGKWDIFGKTEERRMERRLIGEYRAAIEEALGKLSTETHATLLQLAALPEQIRGFGHVKERSVKTAKTREANLLAVLRDPAKRAAAAE